jgi:Asp-tRNA(Asn)/Glu-tRNA(Gln) amidotransferase A subunit family amidase
MIKYILVALGFGFFLGIAIEHRDIESAARLIGIEFTASEIDSMLPGLIQDRDIYIAGRKNFPSNDIAPALEFNPHPNGFEIPVIQKPIYFSPVSDVQLPENNEDLAFYSILELSELIRQRKITSLELTQFFLDRLKRFDTVLECVITLTENRAIEHARKADEEINAGIYRGLLHGIPYGAKDLFAVKGYKTTWGATPYKDQIIDLDATVIEKLDEAGAILVAKLTMGALAWGDVWYGGVTKNPWNPTTGSSGSSAGSASAVAAGLVPFALGTETLGSIVSPSTVCGTTGLRPTFGQVSRHGAMALSWSMDKIGPITRSAEDAALVFAVIKGKDSKDPTTLDIPFNYDSRTDIKGLKIGYIKGDFEKSYAFKTQDSLVLELLKDAGVELIPIELPTLPDLRMILSAEAAAAFDELTISGKDDLLVRQVRNAWPNVFRQARFIPAVEYIQANRRRKILIEEMNQIFNSIDLYINPSWSSNSLTITNYTGHPCITIPNGLVNDTPSSITITGKLYGEADLVHLAKFIQDRTEWHKMAPPEF